ncbi:hypothetical protein WR25_18790 [Diploscapter pachys]|uniref:Dehydrogenase/reductase SDR family member 1 n=1 Tax=Diploscapter pachys TaxID=2018661 RepID=A0A2A2JQR4_9BILA|nr:hypothetical protein WR25_18790 [Diploscapter pachys]
MSKSSKNKPLQDKVALVTGASRGIGRGIALQLCEAGAKVYITGRKPEENGSKTYNTALPALEKAAEECRERGGTVIPVHCDHSNPEDVEELFRQIDDENGGQLDVLVNSAFSATADINNTDGKKFYELDPLFWDKVNNVGLRNNYICSVHAARMMVKKKQGLIVQVSSIGGLQYTFNVAYGVGKAGIDRMAADMAIELKDTGVTVVSLWPGIVKTEIGEILKDEGKIEATSNIPREVIEKAFSKAESPEFVGKAVVGLACDRKVNKKNGKILLTSDLSREYHFKDIDGKVPVDIRSASTALEFFGWSKTAALVPDAIKIPLCGMHSMSNKF